MITKSRQEHWKNLHLASKALGVPLFPRINIALRTKDDGGRVFVDRVEEGHSWTRNGWNFFYGVATDAVNPLAVTSFGPGYLSGKSTASNIIAAATYVCNRPMSIVPYASTLYGPINSYPSSTSTGGDGGILVGTSDQSFSPEDYKLASQVPWEYATGTEGALEHRPMEYTDASYDNINKLWTASLSRDFKNNTDATITIREVGIVAKYHMFSSSQTNHLIIRDVLETAIDITAGQVLTVTYQLVMNFGAID